MRKFAITITFLIVFLGFCDYALPRKEEMFQRFEKMGAPMSITDKRLEYWNFFVSNCIYSGSAATIVWWLSKKK